MFAATLFTIPISIGSVLGWLVAQHTFVDALLIFEELQKVMKQCSNYRFFGLLDC